MKGRRAMVMNRPTGEKDERKMVGQSKGCYQREGTIG